MIESLTVLKQVEWVATIGARVFVYIHVNEARNDSSGMCGWVQTTTEKCAGSRLFNRSIVNANALFFVAAERGFLGLACLIF